MQFDKSTYDFLSELWSIGQDNNRDESKTYNNKLIDALTTKLDGGMLLVEYNQRTPDTDERILILNEGRYPVRTIVTMLGVGYAGCKQDKFYIAETPTQCQIFKIAGDKLEPFQLPSVPVFELDGRWYFLDENQQLVGPKNATEAFDGYGYTLD